MVWWWSKWQRKERKNRDNKGKSKMGKKDLTILVNPRGVIANILV